MAVTEAAFSARVAGTTAWTIAFMSTFGDGAEERTGQGTRGAPGFWV